MDIFNKINIHRSRTKRIAYAGIMIAITAVCAQIQIPFTPVPFTLQVFAVLLTGGILGCRLGAYAQLGYILLGIMGLPIFAGLKGGPAVILSPSFGYALGFPFAAIIAGLAKRYYKKRIISILYFLAGIIPIYIIGPLYLYLIAPLVLGKEIPLASIAAVGIVPFILPDIGKAVLAWALSYRLLPSRNGMSNTISTETISENIETNNQDEIDNSSRPRISVIIPARDEENYIGACLKAIEAAAKHVPGDIEIVVAINRCTDRTEEIALEHGAIIVYEDAKNISIIKNKAAKAASGDILVFLDADSVMTEGLLHEIDRCMHSGKFIGGGTLFKMDRTSLGIFITMRIFLTMAYIARIMSGPYWLFKEDFEAIGGFNEKYFAAEDTELARRLKKLGKKRKQKFGIIRREYTVTSARKFDQFGDWFVLFHPGLALRIIIGMDRKAANKIWYDIER